jgi:hypothetical protein
MTRSTRPRPDTGGRVGVVVLVVVAVLAVLGAALGLRSVLGSDSAPAEDGQLALPHGTLMVNTVTPEIMKHPKGMPASMMPDPVPDGFQRFSVDVTIFADDGSAARYDAAELRVTGDGVKATAPMRGTLGSGIIPDGGRVTGTVLFQVPDDARSVLLGVQGEDEKVRVRVPAGAGHHGG